jgi:hypothetical protein
VTECILWPFAVRKSSGYGAHSTTGPQRNIDAHRYVCTLAHGAPGDGAEAAHRCGNKLCVNPNHLYWADHQTNMQDAKRHGTMRGGGRWRQRLFAPQIADICTSGQSLLALAEKYNSDASYIGRVRRRNEALYG